MREKEDAGSEALIREMQLQDRHMFDSVLKAVDDLAWQLKLCDIAVVDKIAITGPPPRDGYPAELLKSPQEALNPVVFEAYVFMPRGIPDDARIPLLVIPHGGVHSSFTSSYAHVVRELIEQGYCIVAPEYRGSRGYGERFFKLIDYGGLEIEDTFAARAWMVENYQCVDPARVAVIGWSHGGLHALFNVFNHPHEYAAAYACVPVSDLISRMAHKGDAYSAEFEATYHIGRSVHEATQEYRRRSPAWNAERLETPLLVHSTTNDEDVNVLEVEHLIKSLQAANKEFTYKIYADAPGGHRFNRLDTAFARESRNEVYMFLAKHLTPPNPPVDVQGISRIKSISK